MDFGVWDKLFNLVILALWITLWHAGDRRVLFNSYLAPIVQATRKLIDYVRPVMFNASDRAIAGTLIALVILFRAFVVGSGATWGVSMGFVSSEANTGNLLSCILFSVLSFAIFFFQVCGISLIYVHSRRSASFNNAGEALYAASRPFSDLRIDLRPPVLIGAGAVLAILMERLGLVSIRGYYLPPDTGMLSVIIRSLLTSLAGWTGVLPIILNVLIMLIIGSWISMFAQSHGLMSFCRDWINFLVGPLRRYPLQIGPLDLTPIVMIIALNLLHGVLMAVLNNSYMKVL